MKIFILAPHPDDEVLGCGGTIARYAQAGAGVHLVIATKTYTPEWSESYIKNRKKEIEQAAGILGIKHCYFCDWPSVKLDTIPQKELNDKLASLIGQIKPDIVFLPHAGDLNSDHRLLFQAALIALRPPVETKLIACYEVLSETQWGQPIKPFLPNFYCDISSTLNKKLQAMSAYSSELRNFPHPRSLKAIEALAVSRGSEIGFKAAEAFMIIRGVLKI